MSSPATPATEVDEALGPEAPHSTKAGGRPAWQIVMQREITVKLRDKSFWISMLVSLLLIAGGVAISFIVNSGGDKVLKVAVVDDKAAAIVQSVDRLSQQKTNGENRAEAVKFASKPEAEEAVRKGDVKVFLHSEPQAWVTSYNKEPVAQFENLLSEVLSGVVLTDLATRAGVSASQLQPMISVQTEFLSGADQGKYLTGMISKFVFAVVFLFFGMMYGQQIGTSVIEEKQSRIVEILVSAIPVRHLLIGKVIGITLLTMAQMTLLFGAALIGLAFTPLREMMGDLVLASVWFLVFFLAGFLALACIWAAAGAMASRLEDLQYTAQPLNFVMLIAYIVGFSVTGTAQAVASFIPLISTILMPARIIAGDASWWEPVVALALSLIFAGFTVALGARIYQRALLQTGGRLSYRQALQLTD